jgi:hypothetical protein
MSEYDSGAGLNPNHPAYEARWMPDDKPDFEPDDCAVCGEGFLNENGDEVDRHECMDRETGQRFLAHSECVKSIPNLWVSDMPDIDIDSLPEEAWQSEEQQS